MDAPALSLIFAAASAASTYGPLLDESVRRPPDASCNGPRDEIVVCAPIDHPQNQRIERLPDEPPPRMLPDAELTVGGINLGIRTQSGSVGGFTSNRVMFGIKLPLGRRR